MSPWGAWPSCFKETKAGRGIDNSLHELVLLWFFWVLQEDSIVQFHGRWYLGEDVTSSAGSGIASQTVAPRTAPEHHKQRLTANVAGGLA